MPKRRVFTPPKYAESIKGTALRFRLVQFWRVWMMWLVITAARDHVSMALRMEVEDDLLDAYRKLVRKA